MPFDWKGALAGFISPETASSNYFQTRELKKRLAIEQEAKDAAADKAKESERMDIAAAVGPEEIAPGVVRPSYINAAMLQAQRTAAPVQTSANQFTTARAVAPDTARMGKLSAEANMAESIAHERQQRLAASDAEIALGNQDLRSKLFTSGSTAKIAQNEAGVVAAQNEKEKNTQEMLQKIPQLAAAFQAGKLTLGNRETTAQMAAGLPEKTASAAAAKADLDTQEAEQNRITGKLSQADMAELNRLQLALQKTTAGNLMAKAEAEKAISAIKSGAISKAIDPRTGEIDWDALGITSKEVAELTMGYLKGGNMMQNWLGGMMQDQTVNPYARPTTAGPWKGQPQPTPAPGPKVGQNTTAFDAMKSR